VQGQFGTRVVLVTGVLDRSDGWRVQRLRDDRQDVRVLSRRAHQTQTQTEFIRGDLLKGEGLEQPPESVSVVIHHASPRKVIARTG
jgi:nucleoside-diphosphate-sugar epimerase